MNISNTTLACIDRVLSSTYVLAQSPNDKIIALVKPTMTQDAITDELGYRLELTDRHRVIATDTCIIVYTVDNSVILTIASVSGLGDLYSTFVSCLRDRVTKYALNQAIDTSSIDGVAADDLLGIISDLKSMNNPTNYAANIFKVTHNNLEVNFSVDVLNIEQYLLSNDTELQYNVKVNIPKYKLDLKASTLSGVLVKLLDYFTMQIVRYGKL